MKKFGGNCLGLRQYAYRKIIAVKWSVRFRGAAKNNFFVGAVAPGLHGYMYVPTNVEMLSGGLVVEGAAEEHRTVQIQNSSSHRINSNSISLILTVVSP